MKEPNLKTSRAIVPEANGHNGSNGHANGANGGKDINWSDPAARAMLDQLLGALSSETPPPDKTPGRSTLSGYGAVLRRRWKPMLLIFALSSALVAWKLQPTSAVYTAQATMLLPAASTDTGSLDLSGLIASSNTGARIDTQIAIVTSPKNVKRALSQLPQALRARGWGMADAPLKTSTPGTKIKADSGASPAWTAWWDAAWGQPAYGQVPVTALSPSPSLINVFASSSDPDASVRLANVLVDTYAGYLKEVTSNETKQKTSFVKQNFEEKQAELDEAQKRLRDYQAQTQVLDVDQEKSNITSRVAALSAQAQAAQTEAQAGINSDVIQNDGVLIKANREIEEARAQNQRIRALFVPSAPEYLASENRVKNSILARDARQSNLLQRLRERAADRTKVLNKAIARSGELATIDYNMKRLQAKVVTLGGVVLRFGEAYTKANIALSAETQVPSNLVRANAPIVQSRTWLRAVMLGLLIGLTLSALWAALLEQLDSSLHSSEDVESLSRASLLGTLPLLKGRRERRLSQLGDAANAALHAPELLETCRIVRSNLSFASVDAPIRSLLVTSADPGEGKSLCALNLATVMAFDGRRVLLLDCDLRHPSQHLLSETSLEPGLSNVLIGASTLDEAIKPTRVANLSLLSAGTLPSNPPELLGSTRGHELLEELCARFDMVVVDSPPVLSLADAQVLASMTDGALLITAADKTPRNRVLRAQSLLRHAGGRLMGVVLNKVRARSDLSASYSYYGAPKSGAKKLMAGRK